MHSGRRPETAVILSAASVSGMQCLVSMCRQAAICLGSVCVQVAGTMVTPTLIINMLSTCSHRQPITGQQPGQSRR